MTDSLLVIAPHPDDEILGAGRIIASAIARGGSVAVIIATTGSESIPGADPEKLSLQRRQECEAGLIALLGKIPPILFLNEPDGKLDSRAVNVTSPAIASFLAKAAADIILVTDPADGHPDHKAAFGFATRLIAAGHGRKLLVMPISQRVDGIFDPKDFQQIPVSPYDKQKKAALECHSSQIGGAGFSLAPQLIADFSSYEYVRTAFDRQDCDNDAIRAAHFDNLFDASPDPWDYNDAPYERDRFRRTVAALADRHYTSALELGCANAALTEQLAPLCDMILATDASGSAMDAARARIGSRGDVTVQVASLPDELPAGPFDLIVASDMLYYLGFEGIVQLMGKLDGQASPDCRILIASYLGETDTRLTGEMSSETAIAHLTEWRRVHCERTDMLRIDVLERACR